VARGIEQDPPLVLAGLEAGPGRSQRDRVFLGRRNVVDGEVEMELLPALLPRPLW
jgi:hypothetical protein